MHELLSTPAQVGWIVFRTIVVYVAKSRTLEKLVRGERSGD